MPYDTTPMHALVAAVLVALCAAACSGAVAGTAAACRGNECDAPDSGTAPPDESVVPGPRDGSRLTRDGIDRRHGGKCVGRPTPDGDVRCLPDTPYSTVFENVFTDPACTEALAMVPGPDACAPVERLFVTEVAGDDSCPHPDAEARAFRIERHIGSGNTYRLSPGGACERFVEPPSDVGFYRAAVTPTDPDDWVDLVRAATPVTSRLAVSYWEGSDGSRFFDSYRLLPGDEPCEPFPPPEAGRTSYCIPKDALPPSFPNADYACTPLAETLLACDGTTAQTTAYPELHVTLSGSGRLRTAYLTADGREIRALGLQDVELEGPCHREVLDDGLAYCVGAGKFSSLQGGLFIEPACTTSVASFRRDCTEQAPAAVDIGPATTCGAVSQYLEHTEYTGPIYGFTFADPPGCAEYPREEGVAYYRSGASLAPSRLYAPYPE